MPLSRLNFTKDWRNGSDFSSYEESEERVRADLQLLHNETRDALNEAVDTLSSPAGAASVGAIAPQGLSGANVQELINSLASALATVGEGSGTGGAELAELVAQRLGQTILSDYYTAQQLDALISALGVEAVAARVAAIEARLRTDGVIAAEIVAETPYSVRCAELPDAASVAAGTTNGTMFDGRRLMALHFYEGSVTLKSFDIFTGEMRELVLSGDAVSFSSNTAAYHSILWMDEGCDYILLKVGNGFYLVSLKSGRCSAIANGSDCFYRGAVKNGSVITVMIFRSSQTYFYRRSVSGDGEGSPAIAALGTTTDTGSSNDMLIGPCSATHFAVFKYGATDSKIKIFEAAGMAASAEFSTGLSGAYAYDGARYASGVSYFLIYRQNGVYLAKCSFVPGAGSYIPTLKVNPQPVDSMKLVALAEGALYGVYSRKLYIIDAASLAVRELRDVPAGADAGLVTLAGTPFGGLWGGKYLPLGAYLYEPETGKSRAIRCFGANTPDYYAVHPFGGRYFAVNSAGRWFFYDCLLRPVWGMAPYIPAGGAAA